MDLHLSPEFAAEFVWLFRLRPIEPTAQAYIKVRAPDGIWYAWDQAKEDRFDGERFKCPTPSKPRKQGS